MTQVSTSISRSGRPLLSRPAAPRRARFQVAMAPGMQHQPLMLYLALQATLPHCGGWAGVIHKHMHGTHADMATAVAANLHYWQH